MKVVLGYSNTILLEDVVYWELLELPVYLWMHQKFNKRFCGEHDLPRISSLYYSY